MTGHDLLDTLGDIDARFLRNEADMQAKNDGKYMLYVEKKYFCVGR